MSIEDKAETPKPREGLTTVLRQLDANAVPLRVQGELRRFVQEYHAIFAQTYTRLQTERKNLGPGAINALANIEAEREFGKYLREKYGKD